MSAKELDRVEVMGRVKAGALRLVEAAEMLGLSCRQGKRVWARYRVGGGEALAHRGCCRESNRGYGQDFRVQVIGGRALGGGGWASGQCGDLAAVVAGGWPQEAAAA
ncbi:hypothetical protein [Verrucomicrobium sp. 3C]|uniref:hypothetical protein n=1 Tax=Verrucomicrobium sp. 3C TaxID=1134055 RepID=UPI0003A90A54|nr:hypothetical protein [Verrucomicrobium sp. 3C]